MFFVKIIADNLISFSLDFFSLRYEKVGPHPIKIKCPSCAKQITSHIDTETYSKTHFCAAALVMTIV